MALSQIVRGSLLIPRTGGAVDFHFDGVLAGDESGTLLYAGSWSGLKCQLGHDVPPIRMSEGVMLPPLLDVHTHIPQHPIRGRFVKGIPDDAPGGRLLSGLQRNVFPAETRCNDHEIAERVVRDFLADTLAHGVVGGATYTTPSVILAELALSILPQSWSVGLVMMNQNCPPDLRTDEATFEADVERLVAKFGRRLIVTDRFAVAVSSTLRRRGSALAKRLNLRTQTHLNEQVGEKAFVEKTLYPAAASYTDVYRQDGLLNVPCIAAHCIQMTPAEWAILQDRRAMIAHCPTSNLLLGSGVMDLEEVLDREIPFAIATDVGASPTVSMLAEMARFLQVHKGRSSRATPAEALYRATLAAAEVLELDQELGRLEAGRPMSFIEVEPAESARHSVLAEEMIRALLPAELDHPTSAVKQVTIAGRLQRSTGFQPV
jgi:guanine deaminase